MPGVDITMLYLSVNRHRYPVRILGIFLAVAFTVAFCANAATVAAGCKTTCCCCPPTSHPVLPVHAEPSKGLPAGDCCATETMPHCDMQPGPVKSPEPLSTAAVHPETPQVWALAGEIPAYGIGLTSDHSRATCGEPALHRQLTPIYLQNQSFLC